jgi:hypothetical protein
MNQEENDEDFVEINSITFKELLAMHKSLLNTANNQSTTLNNLSTTVNNISEMLINLSKFVSLVPITTTTTPTTSTTSTPTTPTPIIITSIITTTTTTIILSPLSSPIPPTASASSSASSSSSLSASLSSSLISTISSSSSSSSSIPTSLLSSIIEAAATQYFTSKDVPLSSNNWLASSDSYPQSCHACKYYGHAAKACPNIINPTSGVLCYKCWNIGHFMINCSALNKSNPPYRDDYKHPNELMLSILAKSFGM